MATDSEICTYRQNKADLRGEPAGAVADRHRAEPAADQIDERNGEAERSGGRRGRVDWEEDFAEGSHGDDGVEGRQG